MGEKRGRVYNRIFDEQEWQEVNEDNKNIMEDFLEEYKQRKIKPSTIAQYQNDLRIVMIYINRKLKNRSILELNKKDFRRFSLWTTEDLKVSNARSNRLMSAVRSLLSFAEDDEDYDYETNFAKKVKGLPKEKVKNNEDDFFLTFEQVMKLRQELINRDMLQHAVLLMLAFDSAGRRNEIAQVKKANLLEGNRTNIVIGKRGKQFPLTYLDDTKELIRMYLEQRGDDAIESLWIVGQGDNKRPATYQSLYDRVVAMSRILSEIEGRKIEFFPHSLRHSRIECLAQGQDLRLLDENGNPKRFDLTQIKALANHENISTTESYCKDHTSDVINDMFGFK